MRITTLALALRASGQVQAFSQGLRRPDLARRTASSALYASETNAYAKEEGAFISHSVIQDIPLSVDEFWSGFDDYLSLQKSFEAHDDTHLVLGSGRPSNGPGAEIAFTFTSKEGKSTTKEALWQKDDKNKIWVMGIPEPNHVFDYYRCTASAWNGDEGKARARLCLEGVFNGETPEEREAANGIIAKYIPIRIGELCNFVLRRDGLRSAFETEIDTPIDRMWGIVSDWDSVDWVMGAKGVKERDGNARVIQFEGGRELPETLDAIDHDAHTLTYSFDSTSTLKMYEGNLKLTASDRGTTIMSYDNVYIPAAGLDAEKFKEATDNDFEKRATWMKEKFGAKQCA